MANVEWQITMQSHRGNVRRTNEDSLCVQRRYPLMVVADGMGGHAAGEVASQMLVDKLSNLPLKPSFDTAIQQLEECIASVNREIRSYAKSGLEGKTIGTTVVALLVYGTRGACLWAGDSRLYRSRNGRLQQLTDDHSLVAELVRNGEITPEQAASHPKAAVITRAVGARTQLVVDVKTFDIELGDTYLLCSDGLYNELSESELASFLLEDDLYQMSDDMLELCLKRPARDNVTFIVGRVDDDDQFLEDATLAYNPE